MKRLLCLLITLSVLPASAEWGRLFFTPQQRKAAPQASAPEPAPAPSLHRLNGEVHSSSGRSLRWIDDQLSTHPRPKGIKPGQSWDAQNGRIYPHTPDEHAR